MNQPIPIFLGKMLFDGFVNICTIFDDIFGDVLTGWGAVPELGDGVV